MKSLWWTIAIVALVAAPAFAQCPPGVSCPGGACPPNVAWAPITPRATTQTTHPAICQVYVDRDLPASGTLVQAGDRYGVILTAAHLFGTRSNPDVSIRFPNGKRYAGQLDAIDRENDLAAVRIATPTGITPIPVATIRPKQGEAVWFAGYGTGGFRQFNGRVVGYAGDDLVLNPRARPGDSGAPICNSKGELVAVLSSRNDARNETIGVYCGQINKLGFEWAQNRLLPWNAATDRAEIAADAAREQALIGAIGQSQAPPFIPPGATIAVDVEARARLAAIESDVAIGRDIVTKLGLLEADDQKLADLVALATSQLADVETKAGVAIASAEEANETADELKGVAAEAMLAADGATEVADAANDKAVDVAEEQEKNVNGWVWGLVGGLIGAIPGGGAMLMAGRATGLTNRVKERVNDLVTGAASRIPQAVDQFTDRIPGTLDDRLADKRVADIVEGVVTRIMGSQK